jgi:copper chaperone CopZ
VSQGLKAVAGVVDAEVFYDEQRADVEYRPDVVAPGALVEAVRETGFGATLLDESDAEGNGS